MNKRITQIKIKKNDSDIACPYYYELQPWNYIDGVLIYKSDKDKYRFREDKSFEEGDSLIFFAQDIPEKIEEGFIQFHFNFSTKKGDREGMLTITNDGSKAGPFEKLIDITVKCSTVEKGRTGEIIRVKFLKIDNCIKVAIVGYDNHSKEYIDKYVYPFDLILWKSDN